MIIQKLRLEKGWSQQQLAEMSGVSTRTIQRLENGSKPSVETVKSLAAVFEVDFSTLQDLIGGKQPMQSTNSAQASINDSNHLLNLSQSERLAYEKVRQIKQFYIKLLVFVIVILGLLTINLIVTPEVWWVQWVFLGWGIGLIIRALKTFDFLPPFNPEWEKRQVEKYLKRYK